MRQQKNLKLQEQTKKQAYHFGASVTLYADGEEYEFIKGKEELLKEIFIVSEVIIQKGKSNEDKDNIVGVKVEQAKGEKCERCWMYSTTVGEDKENPSICHRCSENLKKDNQIHSQCHYKNKCSTSPNISIN